MKLTPYTRFSVAKEKIWGNMPERERMVLRLISTQEIDSPLKVKELISIKALGSPASIHVALTCLIKSGHLKHSSLPDFGRSKFINLTPASTNLFKKLNTALLACAKN
jgi:hypothetical protein